MRGCGGDTRRRQRARELQRPERLEYFEKTFVATPIALPLTQPDAAWPRYPPGKAAVLRAKHARAVAKALS
jgi:hypothetical protein